MGNHFKLKKSVNLFSINKLCGQIVNAGRGYISVSDLGQIFYKAASEENRAFKLSAKQKYLGYQSQIE